MKASRLEIGLFMLTITIFLVMLMWTLDKFLHPEHAGGVFEFFYKIPVGSVIMYVIGGIEAAIMLFMLRKEDRFLAVS